MARYFYGSGVVPGYANQLRTTISGSVVTIQTGAVWADGFYGEITSNKTLSLTGQPTPYNGIVVARMDPTARTITFAYVAGAGTGQNPTQNLSGIFEVALLRVVAGVGTDIRQFSSAAAGQTVVSEVMFKNTLATSWGATTWAGWWSWGVTKVRPDTLFDIYYMGSGWAAATAGWVEIGLAITGPQASSIQVASHFYFNTISEHHSIVGGVAKLGSELVTAGTTGYVTMTLYIRNQASTGPSWRIDGNDMHTVRIVEHL